MTVSAGEQEAEMDNVGGDLRRPVSRIRMFVATQDSRRHTLNATTIHNVLTHFREAARDNRDLGDLFERLIVNYLVTDPQYAELFGGDVWMWSEWKYRWGMDTGIDIVARERATGDFWAIQCKFYLPDHRVSKADVDSFLAASGRRFATDDGERAFVNRLVVSTTNLWGSNAEAALEDQRVPVERLSVSDLDASPIDWSKFDLRRPDRMRLRPKKDLRDHQREAVSDVRAGFAAHDRGKLIMACGTGKTYVALRIAEDTVPNSGRVLFMAPSISLVAQALREWTADARTPFHALVVCSDTKVGREDEDTRIHDVPFPATTDPNYLAHSAEALAAVDCTRRTVIFATYQSIEVIEAAQKHGLGDFDLVICDEAHRTTGLTRDGDNASAFVRVHDNKLVRASKRLYMTATPRIFAEASKEKAASVDADLYSMDDEAIYGPEFHRLGFGEAVRRGLLCDYRVLLVATNEEKMAGVANAYAAALGSDDKRAKAIDSRFVAKIFGSWKGLAKKDVRLIDDDGEKDAPDVDRQPMRRAIAFSSSIKGSKTLTDTFPGLLDLYRRETGRTDILECKFDHVDGGMNALERRRKLDWLKADTDGACRVLSNARCLSEGIDVPALDGVIFFDTRDSVVDIVQSVGRVMRKPNDEAERRRKEYGYIILPVGIPSKALDHYDSYIASDAQFKGIWKVIKALRAHDESLVDEAEFRNKIRIIDGGDGGSSGQGEIPLTLPALPIGDISEAVYAAIPKKLGDTAYWHDWAASVADIAQAIIGRINALLKQPAPRKAFDSFVSSLHKNINPAVTDKQAVEMLAQHMVTRPVFEALFEREPNRDANPVSRAMERVVRHIDRHGIGGETEGLEKFYTSIRDRASLAKSEKSRQELIRSLYDSFFATAFKEMAKDLGVVYTPVEVVDFILRSADDLLHEHFDRRLADKQVHILDPFTGTGTFIARLLQDAGLIGDADIARKYHHELHANEIVLLAYYVAGVNIESAYRSRVDADENTGFPGIVLTDTFQMREGKGLLDPEVFAENSDRIQRQREKPIRVIVGNPPYSVTQGGAKYPRLDARIEETYVRRSTATNKNSLYDSYIRAFRWASDRIGEEGVICFVTNGGWLDGNTADGFRRCLADEFSDVYVLSLRGNARTSGEQRRMEGDNVFEIGSRAPIAITLLVKHKAREGQARIHYYDIGDYLSRVQKLARLEELRDSGNVEWGTVTPDDHGDWINQRNDDFGTLVPLNDEPNAIFVMRSNGLKTQRDDWAYNFSRKQLAQNTRLHLDFYNSERERIAPRLSGLKTQYEREERAKGLVEANATRGKWTRALIQSAARGTASEFNPTRAVIGSYRPFAKSWVYYDVLLNEMSYRMPSIFPRGGQFQNLAIMVKQRWSGNGQMALMVDVMPDLQSDGGAQCFPLHWYSEAPDTDRQGGLSLGDAAGKPDKNGYVRHAGITDAALANFRAHYRNAKIIKEDIFYYVYGLLHSPEYRERYATDLKKVLPRVPMASEFRAFSDAGRKLAALHVGYEHVDPYPLKEQSSDLALDPKAHYQVKKMTFARGPNGTDRSSIVVNEHLTLLGIPAGAYDYVVNGKSAIEWVMERYQVTKDKDSGIVNDPNDWCREHNDPRYIVDLVKRVVTVSVETMKIVRSLPAIGPAPTRSTAVREAETA